MALLFRVALENRSGLLPVVAAKDATPGLFNWHSIAGASENTVR